MNRRSFPKADFEFLVGRQVFVPIEQPERDSLPLHGGPLHRFREGRLHVARIVAFLREVVHALAEEIIRVHLVVGDTGREAIDEGEPFVLDPTLHEFGHRLDVPAESPCDIGGPRGEREGDRIDGVLDDTFDRRRFRLHPLFRRRARLAGGETVDLVVHDHVGLISDLYVSISNSIFMRPPPQSCPRCPARRTARRRTVHRNGPACTPSLPAVVGRTGLCNSLPPRGTVSRRAAIAGSHRHGTGKSSGTPGCLPSDPSLPLGGSPRAPRPRSNPTGSRSGPRSSDPRSPDGACPSAGRRACASASRASSAAPRRIPGGLRGRRRSAPRSPYVRPSPR